jgi:hypothetical protein
MTMICALVPVELTINGLVSARARSPVLVLHVVHGIMNISPHGKEAGHHQHTNQELLSRI